VFVDEQEIAASVAENPEAFEPLRWGQRVRGLRIDLGPKNRHPKSRQVAHNSK